MIGEAGSLGLYSTVRGLLRGLLASTRLHTHPNTHHATFIVTVCPVSDLHYMRNKVSNL